MEKILVVIPAYNEEDVLNTTSFQKEEYNESTCQRTHCSTPLQERFR